MNARDPSLSIVKNTAKNLSSVTPDVGRHVHTSEGIRGAESTQTGGGERMLSEERANIAMERGGEKCIYQASSRYMHSNHETETRPRYLPRRCSAISDAAVTPKVAGITNTSNNSGVPIIRATMLARKLTPQLFLRPITQQSHRCIMTWCPHHSTAGMHT